MGLETKSYEEWLKELGMFNQNERKLRADMIFLQGLEELSQGRDVDVFSAVSRALQKEIQIQNEQESSLPFRILEALALDIFKHSRLSGKV